jgi:oxygen-independent coproporphyrinogen-3 oxidase
MDHFALPQDELAVAQTRGDLQRNFMGYTTHAQTDLVGLGVSAISRIGDAFAQNERFLPGWESTLDGGGLPLWRGLELSADDRLREDVIQQLMCRGEIDVHAIEARHGIDFADYFDDALARLHQLEPDGLVLVSPHRIRATARGRLLLRVLAMCFDAYLGKTAAAPPRYSRVI